MSQYVTKIKTSDGDLQIDYNALANLPELNTMFSNPNLLINGDCCSALHCRDDLIKLRTIVNLWSLHRK